MRTGSRVLILPAGIEQVPVIRRAKVMGLWVIAVDPNPQAEGFADADAHEVASPRDLERCLSIAMRYRVEAVVADQCDYSLFASAYLAERLGLPGPSLEAAQHGTNKRLMRTRCQAAGLQQPPFVVCHTLAEAQQAVRGVGGFPVICKPTDNRGCFGVSKAEGPEDLGGAFFEALANAHSREVLVERFITGTMVTVDGYYFDSQTYQALGIASKQKIIGKRCVDMEVMYPAELPAQTVQRILAYNALVVQALGFQYGPTHGEYIVDANGEVMLIEIANRGGGVLTAPVILPAIAEVDIPELLIRNSFGEFPLPQGVKPAPQDRAAVLSFLDFGITGLLTGLDGLEEALQIPGVLAVHTFAKIGQRIPVITDGPTRHGFVIAAADSRNGARALVAQARRMLHVETVP